MSETENGQRKKEKSARRGKQAVWKAEIENLSEIRGLKIEMHQERIEALATEGRGQKRRIPSREKAGDVLLKMHQHLINR